MAIGLWHIFFRSGHEIVVEWPGDLVQPSPITGERLEDHGRAMTPYLNFIGVETELSRQPNRLRSADQKIFATFMKLQSNSSISVPASLG